MYVQMHVNIAYSANFFITIPIQLKCKEVGIS
jgi:hypothetical protein